VTNGQKRAKKWACISHHGSSAWTTELGTTRQWNISLPLEEHAILMKNNTRTLLYLALAFCGTSGCKFCSTSEKAKNFYISIKRTGNGTPKHRHQKDKVPAVWLVYNAQTQSNCSAESLLTSNVLLHCGPHLSFACQITPSHNLLQVRDFEFKQSSFSV
jgi:hypothetical protein